MDVPVAGGTSGKGLAVSQRDGARTFVKMVRIQGGLGFGVSRNQVLLVFTTPKVLADSIDQVWEFGGQANVPAIAGGQGGMVAGAAALSPDVYVDQITETGLNAGLTVAGTRFFADPDLS
jgi:hypothetical protein